MSEPARFILDPAGVSACFAAIGKFPVQAALFAGLPAPQETLPEEVQGDGGGLSDAAQRVFGILAAPQFIANIICLDPTGFSGIETQLFRGPLDGNFVMLSQDPTQGWDIALLTSIDQVLALLHDLTGLKQARESAGSFSTTLSVAGLSVLAGCADLIRKSALESELAHTPMPIHVMTAPLNAAALDNALDFGLAQPDLRSAVTRLNFLTQGQVSDRRDQDTVNVGMAALQASALIAEDGSLSADGIALALGFSRMASGATITGAVITPNGLVFERLILVLFADAILAGTWVDFGETTPPALHLAETSAAACLAQIKTIISRVAGDDAPAAQKCGACGAAIKPEQKFCTGCGAKLDATT